KHYFIRLSEEDLLLLGKTVHDSTKAKPVEQVKQHISKFSILFKDAEFYYKIVPINNDPYPLLQIQCFKDKSFSHFVLPNDRFEHNGKSIWRFPRQPCAPLTKTEA
ncbi:hypothetical protein, partial [Salmonella sp. s51228]|uniref:hypothetical protein n=1 Tax=Salmonella sp. s51228 TaxID=3159652 RepID=UPI00397F8D16